jgi:hypothetical protein
LAKISRFAHLDRIAGCPSKQAPKVKKKAEGDLKVDNSRKGSGFRIWDLGIEHGDWDGFLESLLSSIPTIR